MSANKKQTASQAGEKCLAASIFEYFEMLVFAAIAVILLMTFAFRLCVVKGGSMNNTLLNGERLLVSDIFYTPKQGDIIVFHQTSDTEWLNEPIVKRVIATEGQYVKLDYDRDKVYVSADEVFTEDEMLNESAYAFFEGGHWVGSSTRTYLVPEGHVFVLGDNRNNSVDSSDPRISFVDTRRILGKVLCRITPLSKFGPVS